LEQEAVDQDQDREVTFLCSYHHIWPEFAIENNARPAFRLPCPEIEPTGACRGAGPFSGGVFVRTRREAT
jgi:hypothetical protein